jgi:hypothetical protein
MELKEKEMVLKLYNKDAVTKIYPSFTHLIIDGKQYPITGSYYSILKKLKIDLDNSHLSLSVIVTGRIVQTKGNMPNPTVKMDSVEIDTISLVD